MWRRRRKREEELEEDAATTADVERGKKHLRDSVFVCAWEFVPREEVEDRSCVIGRTMQPEFDSHWHR